MEITNAKEVLERFITLINISEKKACDILRVFYMNILDNRAEMGGIKLCAIADQDYIVGQGERFFAVNKKLFYIGG